MRNFLFIFILGLVVLIGIVGIGLGFSVGFNIHIPDILWKIDDTIGVLTLLGFYFLGMGGLLYRLIKQKSFLLSILLYFPPLYLPFVLASIPKTNIFHIAYAAFFLLIFAALISEGKLPGNHELKVDKIKSNLLPIIIIILAPTVAGILENIKQEEQKSTEEILNKIEEKREIEEKFLKRQNLRISMQSVGQMSYEFMNDYCHDLREGGFSDWRVMTVDDLGTRGSGTEDCTEIKDYLQVSDFDWQSSDCNWIFDNKTKNIWALYPRCLADKNYHATNGKEDEICNVKCVRDSSQKEELAEIIRRNQKEANKDIVKFDNFTPTKYNLQWSKSTMHSKNWTPNSILRKEGSSERDEECQNLKTPIKSEYNIACHTYVKAGEYQDPKLYCDKLREDGFTDWRLPTLTELQNLTEEEKEKIMENTNKLRFLSSTYPTHIKNGWIFDLEDGRTILGQKNSETFFYTNVVCVRDLKEKSETVKYLPNSRKLEYKEGYKTTFDYAKKCQAWNFDPDFELLSNPDNDGWRLPTIDELRMFITTCNNTKYGGNCKISEEKKCLDEKCYSEACNGCYFGMNKVQELTAELAKIDMQIQNNENQDDKLLEKYDEVAKKRAETYNSFQFSDVIHSKELFWSSTVDPDNPNMVWGVDFESAKVVKIPLQEWQLLHDKVYIISTRANFICVKDM